MKYFSIKLNSKRNILIKRNIPFFIHIRGPPFFFQKKKGERWKEDLLEENLKIIPIV